MQIYKNVITKNLFKQYKIYDTCQKVYWNNLQTCGITTVNFAHPFYSPSCKIGRLISNQKVYCTSSDQEKNFAKHKEHVANEFRIYFKQNKDKLRDTEQRLKEKRQALIQDIKQTRNKVKEKVEGIIERENIYTIPNLLCVARIILSPYLGLLIVQSEFDFALAVLGVAAVTDLLDGWIARTWESQSSNLGSFLDPMADKVLIASLFLSLTYADLIPIALTGMIIARDVILVAAGFVIRYKSLPPPRTFSRYFDVSHATAQLAPTFISKVNTGVQLLLVGSTLAAPVFHYVGHPVLEYLCSCKTNKHSFRMSSKNSEEKKEDPKPVVPGASSDSTAGMSMEHLRRYLAEKLGFYDDDDESEAEKPKVLDEVNIDGIVDYIKKKNCKNIITMAGAGISTSAGIPDFRSPGTGLYHNLQKYKLPHPQAIFELDFFRENPRPFFELAKELYPGTFKPTVCHYFIKMLEDKGHLLRHYTQNIDTLERVAGVPDGKLVEAHGTFHTGHCMQCRMEYTQQWMKERIFKDDIPICEECPGVVKPDIVFFGENLPEKFHKLLHTDFAKCDLLIILGSSLAVQPFASLVDRAPHHIPRLLINREKAGHRTGIMAMMGIGGGLDFDGKDNTRDVVWLGDCDEGCQLLADKLGWGDELRELCKNEHEKIDKAKKDNSVSSKKEKEGHSPAKEDQSPKL